MDNQDWIQGKLKLHQYFRFSRQFRNLEHSYMLTAVAPNGGSIAITSDKTQILAVSSNDPTIENICLFDNQGDMVHKFPIQNHRRQVIKCFDFLKDQRLLAVFEKAYYWIVDPHLGTKKRMDLKGILKDGETILEAKICGSGFGFITSLFKFRVIPNVNELVVKDFYDSQITDELSHWTIYQSRNVADENIQINYPHPKAGIIQIFQKIHKDDIRKRFIYNKEYNKDSGPDIPYITFISQISPNGRSVVYFCAIPVFKPVPQNLKPKKNEPPPPPPVPQYYNYKLILTLADGTSTSHKSLELKKLTPEFINQKRCPKKIIWCGNETLVIQYYNQQLYIIFITENFQMHRIQDNRPQGEQFTFIRQQVDGIRMITKNNNQILRKIPKCYHNIFSTLSQKPSCELFHTYEAFRTREAFQDDDIKKDKKKLGNAVMDCIESSKFEEDQNMCMQLLKTASYGKTFLPPNVIDNNSILETCKKMRVLNEIRTKLKRVMTFSQFEALTEDGLLNILLRYHLHYLAFEIFKFLKKSLNFRIQIYAHWAQCKIESNQSDQVICESIKSQLQNQKGVSFTEMAYKAIQVGKIRLALKLLQEEPSLTKKVPLYLWMGTESNEFMKYYNKAISTALESFDPDLLCLCIQQIRTSQKLTEIDLFKIFSQNLDSKYTLISYYRIFDKSSLIRYYDIVKQYDNLALFCLNQAYVTTKYVDQVKFMEATQAKFNLEIKNPLNEWRKRSLSQYINLYSTFIKNFPKAENRGDGGGKIGVKPGPINELIDIFISKNNVDEVDNLKGLYDIPDKRIVLSRIKMLIAQGRFEELEKTIDQFQKKMKLPVEMFAGMVMEKGEFGWGLRILSRIPDKDKKEEYTLLQRVGRVKDAIDAATRRKDYQGLNEMKDSIEDLNLLAHLNEQLISIAPKKK